ncbi:enoyl-CoA hydratase-related protein [Amycolatopsis sp. NPDC051371]|uniref:enoyl-CoA hydratase-related protein n=1 Tax=Amycolatopsis sp. NPDC051371 TaxID=3155800 RepID=UPI0034240281
MLDLQYLHGIVVIRLRPTPQRLMDHELPDRLGAALAYIGPDRSIVLTGTGDVFAPDFPAEDTLARSAAVRRLTEVRTGLLAHPRAVVAAVNGDADGAGWALAEAADVRVMSGGLVRPSRARSAGYPVTAAVAAGLVEYSSTPARLLDDALTLAGRLEPRAVAAG